VIRHSYSLIASLAGVLALAGAGASAEDNAPPPGFRPLFNGKDLSRLGGNAAHNPPP